VVDVETTGLRPASNRVLQIAVAQLDSRGGMERAWTTLLDPGCDPGPVHIHGITAKRLAGAPRYEQVAQDVADLLRDRVLVAHNAKFDWQFLAAEAHRATHPLPVRQRLCTMSLIRRLDLPVPNYTLSGVAASLGVTQRRAHDAQDDTRVLAEIFRRCLAEAKRVGLALPLTPCEPHGARHAVFPAPAPRQACAWRDPGRLMPGQRLTQGMKVAITGATRTPREELTARATTAGLDVMNNVSSRTSLLVSNDRATGTGKLGAATRHGVLVLSEDDFLTALTQVAPGTPKSSNATPRPASPAAGTKAATPPSRGRRTASVGPLTGRRILVLGGPHERACEVRARISAGGGIAAVNLTASTTDVVALPGAAGDARWERVRALELPLADADTLQRVTLAAPTAPPTMVLARPDIGDATEPVAAQADPPPPTVRTDAVSVLSRGSVIDLPETIETGSWQVWVQWADQSAAGEVDVVAFLTDSDEQVATDSDFLFYNAPAAPDGSVELALGTPGEALLEMRLGSLPDPVERIVLAAALSAGTFGNVGPVELALQDASGATHARATLDAATTERTMLLATIYRRAGTWRLRAIGQGHEEGLTALATRHGVNVEVEQE
jgi:DNA polymerase-3 subunit epsilon